MSLKIVFMGTPDFAVPTLARLLDEGQEIAAVYTQPPRAAGRGLSERLSPVHAFASEHGLAVRTPASLKGEGEAYRALSADAAVVAAYGLILPPAILGGTRLGAYNVHASLLPRWRGAAPIARAIMAGDAEAGVSIMHMEAGLDTGPVCLVERISIAPGTTAGELHDRLARMGAELMAEAMRRLEAGRLECSAQPDAGITYAAKIDKGETRIDFARPRREVLNHVHGLSPFPGAWFQLNGTRVKVLAAEGADGGGAPGTVLDERLTIACADGAIRPRILQREGKAAIPLDAFLRGTPVPPGTRLE